MKKKKELENIIDRADKKNYYNTRVNRKNPWGVKKI